MCPLQVRASNLQDLVYKNGLAGITKATVSITFDNSNKKQSPLGFESHDEITVTRQVGALRLFPSDFIYTPIFIIQMLCPGGYRRAKQVFNQRHKRQQHASAGSLLLRGPERQQSTFPHHAGVCLYVFIVFVCVSRKTLFMWLSVYICHSLCTTKLY